MHTDRKHGHDHTGFAGNQAYRPIGAEDQAESTTGHCMYFCSTFLTFLFSFMLFSYFQAPADHGRTTTQNSLYVHHYIISRLVCKF